MSELTPEAIANLCSAAERAGAYGWTKANMEAMQEAALRSLAPLSATGAIEIDGIQECIRELDASVEDEAKELRLIAASLRAAWPEVRAYIEHLERGLGLAAAPAPAPSATAAIEYCRICGISSEGRPCGDKACPLSAEPAPAPGGGIPGDGSIMGWLLVSPNGLPMRRQDDTLWFSAARGSGYKSDYEAGCKDVALYAAPTSPVVEAGAISALRAVLDAHDAEAKAEMAMQNAATNFGDSAQEADAYCKAAVASSEAEKAARALLKRHSMNPGSQP